MFSFFKKKIVVPHVRLTGVIGAAGRFKQGMDLAGQRTILKKHFLLKKLNMWLFQLIHQGDLRFSLI